MQDAAVIAKTTARALLAIARDAAVERDPAVVSAEIARSIHEARQGLGEEVLGHNLPGLASLEPEIAGRIYESHLGAAARQELGAFYTPSSLAKRLVRLALAGRREVSLVDPACGAGAFLLEAARILAARLKDRRLAAQSVYGIDRDPGALLVCRAILKAHGFDLPDGNLACADALTDTWPTQGDRERYDAVVGNPPYRNIVRLDPDYRRLLKSRYTTFRNKCDLYCFFIEAAAERLTPGGKLSLLVSTSFLGASSFAPLRKLLFGRGLLQSRLLEIIEGEPFRGAASVRVAAIVAERVPEPSALAASRGDVEAGQGLDFGASHSLPSVKFTRMTPHGKRVSCTRVDGNQVARLASRSAHVPADPRLFDVAHQMSRSGVALGELAVVALGVKTGDDRRFVTSRTGSGREPGDGSYEATSALLPCVRGRDVCRFGISWKGLWLDYRPDELRRVHGARPRRREHFDRNEKLLLRETSGSVLIASYDDRRLFPLDTLHSVYPKTGAEVTCWYLLGVLNSAPASIWYGLFHPGAHVKAGEVRLLPVPRPVYEGLGHEPGPILAETLRRIDETSNDCSSIMSLPHAAREPGASARNVGEIERDSCQRQAHLRTLIIEELARRLSSEHHKTRAPFLQSVLDELVAQAFGIDLGVLAARRRPG